MTALEIVQKTVRERLPEGGFAIDATAGRGHDTVFLARTVGKSGRVLAFDIQQAAVDSTRALLEKEGLTAEVVLASHADMASYAEPESADCILFNLGWLPSGDHTVFTRAESTTKAIEAGLDILRRGGLMCVTVYSGGANGYEERDALIPFLSSLDDAKEEGSSHPVLYNKIIKAYPLAAPHYMWGFVFSFPQGVHISQNVW